MISQLCTNCRNCKNSHILWISIVFKKQTNLKPIDISIFAENLASDDLFNQGSKMAPLGYLSHIFPFILALSTNSRPEIWHLIPNKAYRKWDRFSWENWELTYNSTFFLKYKKQDWKNNPISDLAAIMLICKNWGN